MKENILISLKNIVVEFDGQRILKGINLDIHDEEFVTFLGPSGCGKTTTLRIIGGFVEPNQGEIYFDGKKINGVPPYKRNVNTVFQRYALFPHLNVFDNVAFGLNIKRWTKSTSSRRFDRCSRWWVWSALKTATSTSFPAASSSASPSRAPWSTSRRFCCSTSRWARSTSACARTCKTS